MDPSRILLEEEKSKKRKLEESRRSYPVRQSAISIAQVRLHNACRSMDLIRERESHRLAFHKANENLQAHIASLPPAQREIVETMEKELHIGLANPLRIPDEAEKLEVPKVGVPIDPKDPVLKERTPAQVIRAKESVLKNKIRSEKKRETMRDEGKIAKWEKELEIFKSQRAALKSSKDEKAS